MPDAGHPHLPTEVDPSACVEPELASTAARILAMLLLAFVELAKVELDELASWTRSAAAMLAFLD